MAPPKSVPADEIRRLYRLPLEEFTAERNALVKRLRKEKAAEAAKEAQTLAKPSPSAWAVNILFEREPGKMKELVAAGERARDAQGEAVSGRGAAALKEALKTARGLADELRWEAGRLLAEGGRAPSREVVERISANLQALAFSPSSAEEAARGWLESDLDPPGFEVLAGLAVAQAPVVDLAARREAKKKEEEAQKTPPAPEPAPAPPPERSAKEEKREEEARRKKEAAEQARRRREAEERRRRIEAAKEKVDEAKQEADATREAADQAEKDAAAARRQAEAAARAAERAAQQAEAAAERLERARERLREAEEN